MEKILLQSFECVYLVGWLLFFFLLFYGCRLVEDPKLSFSG